MILHLAVSCISYPFTSCPRKLWLRQSNFLEDLASKTKIPSIRQNFMFDIFIFDYTGNPNDSYSEPYYPHCLRLSARTSFKTNYTSFPN